MDLEAAILDVLNAKQGVNQLEMMKALDDESVQVNAVELLKGSAKSEVRQFCGVMLRRKCQKNQLGKPAVANLKAAILERIALETEMSVVRSLCDLTASIAAKLLGDLDPDCSQRELERVWPELMPCLSASLTNATSIDKGIRLLSAATEEAPEILALHITALCKLINSLMTSQSGNFENMQLLMRSAGNIAPICSQDNVGDFRLLVPKSIEAIQRMIQTNPDEAGSSFEIFENFAESELSILSLHSVQLTEFLYSVAQDMEKDETLRLHGLHTLAAVVSMKRKLFTKPNVLDILIKNLWNIIDLELKKDDQESIKEFCLWQLGKVVPERVLTACVQTFQTFSGSLPASKLVTAVFELSRAGGVNGPSPISLMALGAIIEDCSEFITENCLDACVQATLVGVASENSIVRLSAFFALAEVCQFLPMNILLKGHINNILATISTALNSIVINAPVAEQVELVDVVVLNCLDELFDNLPAENVAGSFDALLTKVVELATQSLSMLTRQTAHTVLHRICEKYGELTAPRANQLADFLTAQITQESTGPQMQNATPLQQEELRLDAIHTLTALIEGLGKKMHKQLMAERPALFEHCLKVCAMFLQHPEGVPAEYKAKVYFLISELAPFVADRLVPELPTLTTFLMQSLKASPMKNGGPVPDATKMDDEEEDADDMDFNSDVVDEVAAAVTCFGSIAGPTGTAFLPYYNDVFENIWLLATFPSSTIRDSVIAATCDLFSYTIKNLQAIIDNQGSNATDVIATRVNNVFENWMNQAYQIIDMEAVSQVLAGLEEALRRGRLLLTPLKQFVPLLLGLVLDTFNKKLRCQTVSNDEFDEEDDEEEESERRRVLLEQACELASATIRTFGMIDEGVNLLNKIFDFLAKTAISKRSGTGEKSMAYGGMADIVDALQHSASNYGNKLYPALLKGLADRDDEVRQNAVYALGTVCNYCHLSLSNRLDDVYVACERLLNSESEPSVRDNILATMSRVTIRGPPGSHKSPRVAQFAGKLASYMPFRGDPNENRACFSFFLWLLSTSSGAPIHGDNWVKPLVESLDVIVKENLLNIEQPCPCHSDDETLDIYADECRSLLGTILSEMRKNCPTETKLNSIAEAYTELVGQPAQMAMAQ